MTFFQNPFTHDFRGNWVLADRHQSLTFTCPGNAGRGDEIVVSWADEPLSFAGVDADLNPLNVLTIFYSLHQPFERWHTLTVTVTPATTHQEVMANLNANATFAAWFEASRNANNGRVQFKSRKPSTEFRFYVANGGAEEVLLFNFKAGVSELPAYFDRHKVTHLFATEAQMQSFPDRMNQLVPLDPFDAILNPLGSAVEANVVTNAVNRFGASLNYDPSVVQADWQLLGGRSGLFMFQNICLDNLGNIAQIIEYQAGSKVGDMARKICYYRAGNTNPIQITEEPYVLTALDLVTPNCTDCTGSGGAGGTGGAPFWWGHTIK